MIFDTNKNKIRESYDINGVISDCWLPSQKNLIIVKHATAFLLF